MDCQEDTVGVAGALAVDEQAAAYNLGKANSVCLDPRRDNLSTWWESSSLKANGGSKRVARDEKNQDVDSVDFHSD